MEDIKQTIANYYQEKGLGTEGLDGLDYGNFLCLGFALQQLEQQFEQQEEE
jgi:hypothetical protein